MEALKNVAAMAAEDEPREIFSQIKSVQSDIWYLQDAISQLERRLEPILCDTDLKSGPGSVGEDPTSSKGSQLTETLKAMSLELCSFRRRVERLNNYVEI